MQAAAAALLAASPLSLAGSALAGEFDLLAEGTPSSYVLDDAGILNKTTRKSLNDDLKALEVGRQRTAARGAASDCAELALGHGCQQDGECLLLSPPLGCSRLGQCQNQPGIAAAACGSRPALLATRSWALDLSLARQRVNRRPRRGAAGGHRVQAGGGHRAAAGV